MTNLNRRAFMGGAAAVAGMAALGPVTVVAEQGSSSYVAFTIDGVVVQPGDSVLMKFNAGNWVLAKVGDPECLKLSNVSCGDTRHGILTETWS